MKHVLPILFIVFLGLVMGGTGSYVGFHLLTEDVNTYDQIPYVVSESVPETVSESTDSGQTDRAIGGMVDAAHAGESGQIISGETTAPYRMFDSHRYEQALADEQVLVLYFCSAEDPICQVESPDIAEGFDKLTVSNVVGFQIDYNQETMSEYEKNLVETFDIDTQHTKLVLVDGEEALRSSEAWTTPRFVEAIGKVVNDR
ncbi:MAG: hypothetical protein NUV98_06270 [Candidatus Roizmanbacteria bacterium]|nr:hypothetical protein [Candidatus Roizmanbacteria bacterium]